jgi:hypothetical protein
MKRIALTLTVGTIVSILAAGTAQALRVPAATLNSLVIDSPVVLIGTVVGQRFRSYGENKAPYTVYSLRLRDVVYGKEQLPADGAREIQLPVFGGLSESDRITTVVGTTRLEMGQTYMLFLRGGKWSLNPLSGWDQGAFRLVFAGHDIGRIVLSLDGKALLRTEGEELIFQAPVFDRTRPDGQCEPDKKVSGFTLDRAIQSKPQESVSDEEELAAERQRLPKLEPGKIEPETHQKTDRRAQLKAWLGGEPMSLENFVEIVKARRAELADRIPEDRRSVSFEPVPPSGQGMAPPKPGATTR